jgi:hypothetical protein
VAETLRTIVGSSRPSPVARIVRPSADAFVKGPEEFEPDFARAVAPPAKSPSAIAPAARIKADFGRMSISFSLR